ncbi:MAG: hypothetical protein JW904_10760 [Spirochaetales bacterium]|nr:hypothetical protein [Spirochaetales bacterium]
MKKLLLVFISLFISLSLAFNQPDTTAAIKNTEQLCSIADTIQKGNPNGDLFLIRQMNFETFELLPWQTLESAPEAEMWMMQLVIYKHDSNIILAVLAETSPSGDWETETKYYFWPDGSIAKTEALLSTFLGNAVIHREYIYDKTGKLLKQEETIRDMNTGVVIERETASFMDKPPELFLTLDELKTKLELPDSVK